MIFYLGTHITSWLFVSPIPLFISAITLRKRKGLKPAVANWALDSGGFSELNKNGTWSISPKQYVQEVTRWDQEIGNLKWAAIQDWMCEEKVLQKTGLTVLDHQKRTIDSLKNLLDLKPDFRWLPVLQGWTIDDYKRHFDMYLDAGFDLTKFETVGVGSVCRRQGTKEATTIIKTVASLGVKIHAFGFKTNGLFAVRDFIQSADSLAWSFAGRKSEPLEGHTHINCANCPEFAIKWRTHVLLASLGIRVKPFYKPIIKTKG